MLKGNTFDNYEFSVEIAYDKWYQLHADTDYI